jgi:hypothetical protein
MPTSEPSIVRVSAEGTFNGEQVVNVFHFRKSDLSAATTADLASLLALLDGAVGTPTSLRALYQNMDSGLTISRLYARTEEAETPHESERSTTIAGTNAGNDLPPMLTIMVKWRSDVASRRGRGRTYLPGMTVGQIDTADSDRLLPAAISGYQTIVTAWVNGWVANLVWDFGIYSRVNHLADAPTGPFSEVASAAIDPIIRIQRRRRQGG